MEYSDRLYTYRLHGNRNVLKGLQHIPAPLLKRRLLAHYICYQNKIQRSKTRFGRFKDSEQMFKFLIIMEILNLNNIMLNPLIVNIKSVVIETNSDRF